MMIHLGRGFENLMSVKRMLVHKNTARFPVLSCGVRNPTLRYPNRNHELLFKIPPLRRLRILWELLASRHTASASRGPGWCDHKNTGVSWRFCGCCDCWCCDSGSGYLLSWTSTFFTAVLLVKILVYKKKKKTPNKIVHSLHCVWGGEMLNGISGPSWSGLCLRLCKLCSLQQLMFLSHGFILDQGKI